MQPTPEAEAGLSDCTYVSAYTAFHPLALTLPSRCARLLQAIAAEGRSSRTKWVVAATAVVAVGALGLVASVQHTRSTSLVSEMSALQALHSSNSLMRDVGRVRTPAAATVGIDREADALIAAAAQKVEDRALRGRSRSSKLSAKQLKMQRLAAEDGDVSDRDPPTLYEGYKEGDVGIAGISKWVPEDHPEGHKDCPLHDIDCDELWPWGKVRATEKGPPVRHSILGDNMIGLDSGDDAIVPTEDSGLLPQARPYVDQFDHWPEASKKNKDLLYGTARNVISAKYTGVGDTYVPIEQLEDPAVIERQTHEPIADMMFGTWHQVFFVGCFSWRKACGYAYIFV